MAPRGEIPPNSSVTAASGRGETGAVPDLRLLHYNDVYHVDPASAEPVGGLARFMHLCQHYRHAEQFKGQSELLTFFSGDAFNPSLESSVTKGRHMVDALNTIGTDCACVGNHDFDFGVKQFQYLSEKTNFPWLLANVLDPALGENVPLGNAKRTHMMTSSNGIKIGLIGLGEREWLETINSLPPNLIYRSASETALELVPELRAQGAEIVICISHQREPNDNKLAEKTGGIMDIILGGHDHYYSYTFIKGTHVLRSGTDFKQLSYIEAWRKEDGSGGWDFDITRRDVTSEIPEHEETVQLVTELTSKLQHSLAKAVGWTATPLDARFSTVRTKESNIGNFVCDVMRQHHEADCAIMASGTIRGDQVYPPGALRIKDIVTCFPFEDPVVLLVVTGQAIWDALENGVSQYPALEGRFPQVSNIHYEFDPRRETRKRILSVKIGGEPCDMERKYKLVTRGYMGRGKDGFTSLLVKSEGGEAEEIIDEENGILISAMLRQYFMGLRTVGQWTNLASHWRKVADNCSTPLSPVLPSSPVLENFGRARRNTLERLYSEETSLEWIGFLHSRIGLQRAPINDDVSDTESENGAEDVQNGDGLPTVDDDKMEIELLLMRKFATRWVMKTGLKTKVCDPMSEAEASVDWTRTIAPVVEGRIKMVQ
ncbi:hypothetical protein V2G26_005724 [Clonostachys chloroleuca]